MQCEQNCLPSDLAQLLDNLKVMTIATPWENGVWSAPLYYLYKNRAFWFFSSPDSRHITGAKLSSDMAVAASIFMDDPNFSNIKGVQMRGKIELTANIDKIDVLSAVSSYIKKFSIPFNGSNMVEALSFISQKYRAKFYRFIPTEVIYMDNTIAIGFKQRVSNI
ncbi:MAG: pyridoxamine 5'-phosphate oxidase family protein [Desulfamplus sp.]|nr:pyridoxamine 5'-phosphate oxidase family protein [Desulfamplus sp.]